jgi:hypothetical protein
VINIRLDMRGEYQQPAQGVKVFPLARGWRAETVVHPETRKRTPGSEILATSDMMHLRVPVTNWRDGRRVADRDADG